MELKRIFQFSFFIESYWGLSFVNIRRNSAVFIHIFDKFFFNFDQVFVNFAKIF